MAKGFEDLEIYRLSERLADEVWEYVIRWDAFARDRVGGQLVEAADSIGANISEGSGRGTFKDNCHFARIARGSFFETRHFLRRAYRRRLLTRLQFASLRPVVSELGPRLTAYVRSLKRRADESGTTPKKRRIAPNNK